MGRFTEYFPCRFAYQNPYRYRGNAVQPGDAELGSHNPDRGPDAHQGVREIILGRRHQSLVIDLLGQFAVVQIHAAHRHRTDQCYSGGQNIRLGMPPLNQAAHRRDNDLDAHHCHNKRRNQSGDRFRAKMAVSMIGIRRLLRNTQSDQHRDRGYDIRQIIKAVRQQRAGGEYVTADQLECRQQQVSGDTDPSSPFPFSYILVNIQVLRTSRPEHQDLSYQSRYIIVANEIRVSPEKQCCPRQKWSRLIIPVVRLFKNV
ncbi:hypothetical protein D1872_218250 [compost metagenome]